MAAGNDLASEKHARHPYQAMLHCCQVLAHSKVERLPSTLLYTLHVLGSVYHVKHMAKLPQGLGISCQLVHTQLEPSFELQTGGDTQP